MGSQSQGRMKEERRIKFMEEKKEVCAFHHYALQTNSLNNKLEYTYA